MMEFFITNIVLNSRIGKLKEENQILKRKLEMVESGQNQYQEDQTGKKKRRRKLKVEVERNYKCSFPGCTKAYG